MGSSFSTDNTHNTMTTNTPTPVDPESKFLSTLAAWLRGENVSATRSAMRFAGDVFWHKETGIVQAVRDPANRRVYVLARAMNDGGNPSNFNALGFIRQAMTGGHEPRYKGKHVQQPDGSWKYVVTEAPPPLTWEVPDIEMIPCPIALMHLGTIDRETVDVGTRAEHARMQRIISSRSKSLKKPKRDYKDGPELPYYLNSLAEHAETSDGQYWRAIDLASLNYLRELHDLEPLPSYDSPIPGLKLKDLKNLVSLAS